MKSIWLQEKFVGGEFLGESIWLQEKNVGKKGVDGDAGFRPPLLRFF